MTQRFEAAQRIATSILNINEQLNESIRQVQPELTPDELKAYKRAVDYVVYDVFDEILEPLYARHPSLKPAGWED